MKLWFAAALSISAGSASPAPTTPAIPNQRQLDFMELPSPVPPVPPVCGGGDSVHNQTDVVGGKTLSKVTANSSAACCGFCFGTYPTADAWIRENETDDCWCVQGHTGTKPADRTAGFRAPTPAPYIPGPLPSAAVLQACEAAVTLDPPGTTRGGKQGHFHNLAANSTTDCAAACCRDWNCAAFSFDAPALSCSLKSGVFAVTNTSAPSSVISGFLAELAAPQVPFQWSTKFHHNVTFADEMFFRTEGDTWPTTWLQDDTQLSACGDRGDFTPETPGGPTKSHMSMFQVNGEPVSGTPHGGDEFTMQQIGGEIPFDPALFCVTPTSSPGG